MSTDNMLSEEDWKNLKKPFPKATVSYWEGSNIDNSYIFVRMSKASTPEDIADERKYFRHQIMNMQLSVSSFQRDIILPEKGLTFTPDFTRVFSTEEDEDESETMALILLDDGHCVKVLSILFDGSIPTLIRTLYDKYYTELKEITVITDIKKFKKVFEIHGSCHHCGPDSVATYVDNAKDKFI